MRSTDECEPWTFGAGALMRNLAKRGLLMITRQMIRRKCDHDDPCQEFHRRRMGRGERPQPRTSTRPTPTTWSANIRAPSAADAERAIAAAKAAFPAWSRSSSQERHDILKRIGDEILARKDELGRLLSREEGKTLAEGIGETVRAGADLPVLLRRSACALPARRSPRCARASTSR